MEERSTRFALTLLIGATIAFTGGCDGDDEPVLGGAQPFLESSLVLRDPSGGESTEFGSGETVTFVLTVRNLTPDVLDVVLPTAQTHEFEVHDLAGNLIWNWARGRNFLAVLTRLRFGPGESRIFKGTWDQKDRDGQQVPPGAYDARGFMPSDVAGVSAPPVRFTILP